MTSTLDGARLVPSDSAMRRALRRAEDGVALDQVEATVDSWLRRAGNATPASTRPVERAS